MKAVCTLIMIVSYTLIIMSQLVILTMDMIILLQIKVSERYSLARKCPG